MGKNVTPNVAIEAKNHMENQVALSVFVLPHMVLSNLPGNYFSN
jgi:hypothetical protein